MFIIAHRLKIQRGTHGGAQRNYAYNTAKIRDLSAGFQKDR